MQHGAASPHRLQPPSQPSMNYPQATLPPLPPTDAPHSTVTGAPASSPGPQPRRPGHSLVARAPVSSSGSEPRHPGPQPRRRGCSLVARGNSLITPGSDQPTLNQAAIQSFPINIKPSLPPSLPLPIPIGYRIEYRPWRQRPRYDVITRRSHSGRTKEFTTSPSKKNRKERKKERKKERTRQRHEKCI